MEPALAFEHDCRNFKWPERRPTSKTIGQIYFHLVADVVVVVVAAVVAVAVVLGWPGQRIIWQKRAWQRCVCFFSKRNPKKLFQNLIFFAFEASNMSWIKFESKGCWSWVRHSLCNKKMLLCLLDVVFTLFESILEFFFELKSKTSLPYHGW